MWLAECASADPVNQFTRCLVAAATQALQCRVPVRCFTLYFTQLPAGTMNGEHPDRLRSHGG